MFEKIAREDDVERSVGKIPGLGAILFKEGHIRIQMLPRVRIQIHCEFLPARGDVDELALTAAKVQDRVVRRDIPREKLRDQCFPHSSPIFDVRIEPIAIDAFELV
jgi:hypothetical protein